MTSTRILLVRHATCALTDTVLLGRAVDVPLDARGERQARLAAACAARERPALVETSPRRRACQTAVALADAAGCPVRVAAALDEVDFGAWAGRSFAELEGDAAWRRWNAQRGAAATPAGETIARVQERALGHLAALAREYAGATLALVTHAEVIRSVLLRALRWPAERYDRFPVAPASITAIAWAAGRPELDRASGQAVA